MSLKNDNTSPHEAMRESLLGHDGGPTLDDEEDLFKLSSDVDSESVGVSGEETDEASENESYENQDYSEYTELKEQMYQDKLNHLKRQLAQLAELKHPEYLRKTKKLEQAYKERMRISTVVKELELEMVEKDFENEKKNAVREFEEKKVYLKEQLIVQLEEKRKMIDQERTSMELTGDSMELKPISTRKLRRRGNEPSDMGSGFRFGPGEKRRKPNQATMNYLLDEKDMDDDLKIINKTLTGSAKQSTSPAISTSPIGPIGLSSPPSLSRDARIEDGKLFYEKRWFRRGQTIVVEERKDGASYGATISAIVSDTIWVRKSEDNSKVSILLSQLSKGKLCIKRKAQ